MNPLATGLEPNLIERQTFLKSNRLLNKSDYLKAFKQGKKLGNPFFLVHFCANQEVCPRLGIVVAKRVVPKAVHRNAFKRMIRESFRLSQKDLKGVDIVVVLKRKPIDLAALGQMGHELKRVWRKLSNFQETL